MSYEETITDKNGVKYYEYVESPNQKDYTRYNISADGTATQNNDGQWSANRGELNDDNDDNDNDDNDGNFIGDLIAKFFK